MSIRNPKTDGNEDLLVAEEDLPEDQTAIRHIEIDNRKFKVVATDPYGLWHIESSGATPKMLDGSFTSPLEAENAIKAYMAAKAHTSKSDVDTLKRSFDAKAVPTINK